MQLYYMYDKVRHYLRIHGTMKDATDCSVPE
jgi:hypothetical protein